MVLEGEPSGVVCCLCPSEYAPNSYCTAELTILPQFPASPYRCFGADELGREQIVAVLTQELPPLDWLAESNKEALELDKEHLKGLLEYLERSPDSRVLYTEYTVTP